MQRMYSIAVRSKREKLTTGPAIFVVTVVISYTVCIPTWHYRIQCACMHNLLHMSFSWEVDDLDPLPATGLFIGSVTLPSFY